MKKIVRPTLICCLLAGIVPVLQPQVIHAQALQAKTQQVDRPGLSDTINLYPVTIIALRPTSIQIEILDLDFMDYMAHDGGALILY